jgi:protein TonB
MAYADQGMSRGKMIGLGIAVIIHIFLGYALITGLALKAVKHLVGPLETVNIKEEAPPPDEPPPPPPKDVEIPPFVPPPVVTVQSDAPPPPTITIQNFTPPPPAQPVFHEPAPPAPAAPTGPTQPATANPRSLEVSEDDYPPASLRAEEEGRTVITISISAQGKVDTCSVTTSSGFPKLDEKTCQIATRRFRFKPALQNGTPVASTKVLPVRWQIRK